MKLVLVSIALFCILFVLAIPMKMANNEFADLLEQEKFLEDSLSSMRYKLSVEYKIIDSLSSRERIDVVAKSLGLEMNTVATKITRYVK
jgi:cell division protein FtsL